MIRARGNFRFLIGVLSLLICCALISACAGPKERKTPSKGVYHIVKKGETAFSIARAYSITLKDLAAVNRIDDVSMIREGQVLYIPEADRVIDDVMAQGTPAAGESRSQQKTISESKPALPQVISPKPTAPTPVPPQPQAPVVSPAPSAPSDSAAKRRGLDSRFTKGRLIWPVSGSIGARFGAQPNKTYHNWVRILCESDANVQAVASGTVIFSSTLKDYGETVIVRHADGYATVYTHLKARSSRVDQSVSAGDVIGTAGETDESGRTYIHFEVRFKGKAQDPLQYLQ